MHSRTLKPRKTYPKHVELTVAPPDPNTSYAHMLAMVGERKKVLDVGCGSGDFASLLVKRECDVVGIDINPVSAEEARRFCTSVVVADLDEAVIPELLEGRQFDAIVFGDVLEHLHEPARTLDESRLLLSERGYVVASIPNISHGSVRLALLSGRFDYQELGILDDSHLRFFTSKTIDELFLMAGFRIEAIERVTLPLFAESDLVPVLDPRDFDEKAVAEIKADPDSETLQFIVKAFPLSNDQRLRTISKRFLAANTELAATKQQTAHREGELTALRAALQTQEQAAHDLREEAERAGSELQALHTTFRELEDAYRRLENDSLAKQNAAMERTLSAQAEYARTLELVAALQAKVETYERLQADVLARGDGEARAALEQLQRETNVLRDELGTERARASQLAGELERVQSNGLLEQSVTLQSAVDDLRAQIAAKAETLERLEAELEAERIQGKGLRAQSVTLQSTVDELRTEIAAKVDALERMHAEVETRAHIEEGLRREVEAKSQLTDELELERSQGDELRKQSATLQSSVYELRIKLGEMHATVNSLRIENARRSKLLDELETERQRGTGLGAQNAALRSAIESLDSEVAGLSLHLSRALSLVSEVREESALRIGRAEADCDELLTDAAAAVDELRVLLDSERATAMARRKDDASNIAEIESQLEVVRKASLADKLVMREYADDFRKRAERLEKDFEAAIRQRDDLYLRVVDGDRVMGESAEYSAKLEADIGRLEADLCQARLLKDLAEAELTGAMEQSEAALAESSRRSEAALSDLAARSDAAIAEATARSATIENELTARTNSLENDLAHQKMVLEHLREAADRERLRAEAAAGDLASLTVRHEILQTNLAEIDNLLVAQTEQLIASTSDERDRLLTLIDTVQSSHFWRLKNWLARVRVRLFGASPGKGAP